MSKALVVLSNVANVDVVSNYFDEIVTDNEEFAYMVLKENKAKYVSILTNTHIVRVEKVLDTKEALIISTRNPINTSENIVITDKIYVFKIVEKDKRAIDINSIKYLEEVYPEGLEDATFCIMVFDEVYDEDEDYIELYYKDAIFFKATIEGRRKLIN